MSVPSEVGWIGFNLVWGGSWPPPNIYALVGPAPSQQAGGGVVAYLEAHPDGHFSLRVDRADGNSLYRAEYQRVQLVGQGSCYLLATWQPASVLLYIDGHPLGPYNPDDVPLIVQ